MSDVSKTSEVSDDQVLAALNAYSSKGLEIDGYDSTDEFPSLEEWGERFAFQMRAALEAATRVPVQGEPNDDRAEMSESSVVAYHQWRKALVRDRLSDDEDTAARIAFYAGWDHARAVMSEPDWEYGLRTRSKSDPERGFFSYAGDFETAWEMHGATYEHCTATIVRRRPAGPWLPVEGETKP